MSKSNIETPVGLDTLSISIAIIVTTTRLYKNLCRILYYVIYFVLLFLVILALQYGVGLIMSIIESYFGYYVSLAFSIVCFCILRNI